MKQKTPLLSGTPTAPRYLAIFSHTDPGIVTAATSIRPSMCPQVKEWQQSILQTARVEGYTRTLMGRYRELPEIKSKSSILRGHAERAAINTPIQGALAHFRPFINLCTDAVMMFWRCVLCGGAGGAADVVMMAMLKASRNDRLRDLGWKMLLQIHDEVCTSVMVLRVFVPSPRPVNCYPAPIG